VGGPILATAPLMPPNFGVFAPIGYVVIALPGEREARETLAALLTGGYDEDEVMVFTSEQVIKDIQRRRQDMSILAFFGDDPWIQDQHFQSAKQGAAFLVVYAPSEQETTRVMNVARRFGVRLAHKYNRRSVEELLVGRTPTSSEAVHQNT
jgi:hypothetical protein